MTATTLAATSFYCSALTYGTPELQDCYRALSSLPTADGFFRYFVEQQIHPTVPDFDWPSWHDPRPGNLKRKGVQVPKFWSSGEFRFLYLTILSVLQSRGRLSVHVLYRFWIPYPRQG